jgi:twitching motility protein PilT
MQTFDQHLTDLVQAGAVTFETAMAAATNPSDFELKMRMFRHNTSPEGAPSAGAMAESLETSPSNPLDGLTGSATTFDFLT